MRSLWWSIALACLPLAAAPAGAVDGAAQAAVWRAQSVVFSYPGRTMRYSCDGLREKLRAILLELGARRDLRIRAGGCDQRAPRLTLEFSTPMPPQPQLKAGDGADLTAVDARYEMFLLTSDALHNFGPTDCELVDEFTRQVLPKLATRGVDSNVACVPYQQTGSHYAVRGEILRALPASTQRSGG